MLSIPRSPRQQGQALPLTLIFLLVLCVGLMVTFNTGQVVNKKVELTNAADAAAYSVAVEQARAWNLAAYMNRGRIANEVAVAQLVSLNSWMTQINVSAKMTETYSNILSAVPYVGFIFKAVAQIAKAADQIMRPIRTGLREASGPAIGLIDQVLNQSYAQVAELAIEQASTAGAMKVAHDVVDANSPNAKVTALSYANLVRQMEQARSEYLQQFNVGQRSLLDVLDSENELFSSSIQLVTAQQNVIAAKYRLLTLGGALLANFDIDRAGLAIEMADK